MVRVLAVIDHLGVGGAQEFLYYLCQKVNKEHISLDVCALTGGMYEERLKALGINVMVLTNKQTILVAPIIVSKIIARLFSGNYDVVHTLLQSSFVIVHPLSFLFGLPSIHSIMAARSQTQKWYFPLMRMYQPFVKYFLTPFRSELRAAGISDEKSRYVEVATEYDQYLDVFHDPELSIAPFSIPTRDPIIVSMGRLHPDKGHEYAIRAWPDVVRVFPNAWLLIVGNGADEERLRTIALAGKTERILFAGFRSDVTHLLSRSCIFLRTSVNEGVNLSTITAMAAKLPVIGFKVHAPKEIIDNEYNGLLVEACNPEALAHAINRILSDRSLAETLSEKARQTIIELYEPDIIIDKYIEIYQDCVHKT